MQHYSKQQFEGYTHRFKVIFRVDDDRQNDTSADIYSDSDSYQKLEDFINLNKSDQVVSFQIFNRTSKEQDEATSKMIDEMLDKF